MSDEASGARRAGDETVYPHLCSPPAGGGNGGIRESPGNEARD